MNIRSCRRHGEYTVPVDDERELEQTLQAMRSLWQAHANGSHSHLDALLDPELRHDERTRNYLASGASGSLRDRYFHPMNGDRVTEGNCTAINEQYQSLVDKATRLSVRLGLPATADWTE